MEDAQGLATLFAKMQVNIFDGIADDTKLQEVIADWRHIQGKVTQRGPLALGSALQAFRVLAAEHASMARFATIAETAVEEQEARLRAAISAQQASKQTKSRSEHEPERVRSIFRDWMLQHLDDPFPSAADRRKLITQVRLSPDESTQQGALDATAVKNFFQNLRRRSGFTSLLRECFNEDRYRCGEAVRRVMKGITDEERAKETPEQRMVRERIERIRDYVAGKFESTKVGDWLKSVSRDETFRNLSLMRLDRSSTSTSYRAHVRDQCRSRRPRRRPAAHARSSVSLPILPSRPASRRRQMLSTTATTAITSRPATIAALPPSLRASAPPRCARHLARRPCRP